MKVKSKTHLWLSSEKQRIEQRDIRTKIINKHRLVIKKYKDWKNADKNLFCGFEERLKRYIEARASAIFLNNFLPKK